MNAEPFLGEIARLLAKARLNVVLIGNAAAALQGSPVTTQDLDFMFRKTPANLEKLKRLADELGAVVMRPIYPASGLYRVIRDRDGLQVDFMSKVDGIRSFASLRSRASRVGFGGAELLVADLRDIIRSKEAADRPQDRAVLPVIRRTSMKKKKASRPPRRASALRKESDRALVEQIRRLLALPVSKRTNFLRVRTPGGGSAI